MLPEHLNGKSADYLKWRDHRLRVNSLSVNGHAQCVEPVEISPALSKSTDAKSIAKLCELIDDHGLACYQWTTPSVDIALDVHRLHVHLSLSNHDKGVVRDNSGLSLLKDMTGTSQGKFIPYTSRAMGWHTDGYYNAPASALRCFTLHAIQQAATGGTLSLIDDRLIFIRMNEKDPDMVNLLSDPNAFTIPGNKDELGHDRPDRTSAVFFSHTDNTLGTHFTTRKHNINWLTPDTHQAALCLSELIEESTDLHHNVRLEPGQGIIARNMLHRRDAFTDDQTGMARQMLRGRYLQAPRVSDKAAGQQQLQSSS